MPSSQFYPKCKNLRAENCSEIGKMVPLTGLEPVLNRFRWILSANPHPECTCIREYRDAQNSSEFLCLFPIRVVF